MSYVKVRLNKEELRKELNLPASVEITAAAVFDSELVLYIKHSDDESLGGENPAPEISLEGLRVTHGAA